MAVLDLNREAAEALTKEIGGIAALFLTPLLYKLPEEVQQSLGASILFPKRLGKPSEFAKMALHIVTNMALNGEVIRLDGALRLPPR